MKDDMEDPNEPLIDPVHGHGKCVIFKVFFSDNLNVLCFYFLFFFSQSLINLLMTGKATSHVFDGEKDVSGLSKL